MRLTDRGGDGRRRAGGPPLRRGPGAAAAENQAEPAIEELEAIASEVLRHPKFQQLLGSSQISAAEKDRILPTSSATAFPASSFGSSGLNRHGRLGLLAPLPGEARAGSGTRQHQRVPVFVRTAVPLDEGQQEALRERVAGMIGATPDHARRDRPRVDRRPDRPGWRPGL